MIKTISVIFFTNFIFKRKSKNLSLLFSFLKNITAEKIKNKIPAVIYKKFSVYHIIPLVIRGSSFLLVSIIFIKSGRINPPRKAQGKQQRQLPRQDMSLSFLPLFSVCRFPLFFSLYSQMPCKYFLTLLLI